MARLIRNTRQQAAPRAAVRHLIVCQHDGRFDSTVEPAAISDLIQQKDQIVCLGRSAASAPGGSGAAL